MQDTAIRFERNAQEGGKSLDETSADEAARPAPRRDGGVTARLFRPAPPRRRRPRETPGPPGGISFRALAVGSDVSADDATLVRRCLRGDAEAVRALVDRFQAEVYGLCVRLLDHRHDAEDVTQEVFLRVFRSLSGWDATRPLKPWVMGIAVNRCRTWLAQRGRRPELADYLHDTVAGPAADDSAELLARDPAPPSPSCGWSTAPSSCCSTSRDSPTRTSPQALDRPVGTVKTWLHRARLEILDRLRRRGMVADEPLTDRVSSGTPPSED